MDAVLDDVIGGRDPRRVRWLSLGRAAEAFGVEERLTDARGLEACEALVSLDLSGHALSNADRLRHLRRLQELDISRNRLRHLEGLGRLHNLRVLNLSGNLVEHVPEQMGLLVELQWLDLSANKLGDPADFANLARCGKLFRLFIKGNPLCGMPGVGDLVLKHCASLVWLDGTEVMRGGRAGRALPASATASAKQLEAEQEAKDKVARLERQVATERASVQTLQAQNHDLKNELEATAQLLARKTSEWAVAEEQASRLQQELAFLRIDASGAPAAAPEAGSEAGRENSRAGLDASLLSIPGAGPQSPALQDGDLAQMEAPGGRADPLAELWGLVSRSPLSGPVIPHGDLADALHDVEHDIAENAKEATGTLRALNMEFAEAKADLADSQNELDDFLHDQTRHRFLQQQQQQQQQHQLSSSTAPGSLASYRSPEKASRGLEDAALDLQSKQEELKDMSKIRRHVERLLKTLRKKLECAQDLLVLHTERLMTDKDEEAEASANADHAAAQVSRLAALEERIASMKSTLREASMHVSMTWTELSEVLAECSESMRNRFPDLVELEGLDSLEEDVVQKYFEAGSGFQRTSTFFDSNVAALSEQVMKVKEYETTVQKSLQGCDIRMQQVRRGMEGLVSSTRLDRSSPGQEAKSPLTPASPAVPTMLQRGEGGVDAAVAQMLVDEEEVLRANVRNAQARIRELQAEILQLKCEAWRVEANLRTKQCSIMCAAVEEKEAAVQAFHKTMRRLQASGALTDRETKAVAWAELEEVEKASEEEPRAKHDHAMGRQQRRQEDARRQRKQEHGEDGAGIEAATAASAALMVASEQKAREFRRKVVDNLVETEAEYLDALRKLVNSFLVPMRRRCLLPPRDLQAICLNAEDIFRLHESIGNALGRCHEPMEILGVYLKRAERLEAYVNFGVNCSLSMAIVEVRRREVAGFANFVRVTPQGDDGCEVMRGLLLRPLQQLCVYEQVFHRLLDLNRAGGNAAMQNRLETLSSVVTDLLNRINCNVEEAKRRAEALAHVTEVIPTHSAMDRRLVGWLTTPTLRARRREFHLEERCSDILLMVPGRKALGLRRCVLLAFSDCVVVATAGPPSAKWRPTFAEERPRRRAVWVFRAADGLTCSRPFQVSTASGDASPRQQVDQRSPAVRLCANAPGGANSGSDVAVVEAVVALAGDGAADRVYNIVEKIVGEFHVEHGDKNRAGKALKGVKAHAGNGAGALHLQLPGVVTVDANGAIEGDAGREVASMADVDPSDDSKLSYVPKYPGTDMAKRREMARRRREARTQWKPPELENVNAVIAMERIRKRDGAPLAEAHRPPESVHALFRAYPRPASDGSRSGGSTGKSSGEFMTPIKAETAGRSAVSARRTGTAKGGVGFGSAAKLERNEPLPFRKSAVKGMRSPQRRREEGESGGVDVNEDVDEVNFDASSPYYRAGGRKSRPRDAQQGPDLSIFKAPLRVLGEAAETPDVGYRSKRLIGLPTDVSNVVKEFHDAEQKYYHQQHK